MGPEFIGHAKDAKNEESPDLSSKAAEEPVDETQTVDENQAVNETQTADETQTVDKMQTVDVTHNQSERDTTENPTQTIASTAASEKDFEITAGSEIGPKMTRDHIAAETNKITANPKTNSEIRVSGRKRIPNEKFYNYK